MPAVVYGKGEPPCPVSLDPADLERLLHRGGAGMNTLIGLQVQGGAQETVLLKALDRDPVAGTYLHADFYRVDLERRVEVSVPVHLVGKARGVELGGIVDHPLHELEIECLPGSIPDAIEVDISELDVGESLHVRDLVLPEGVTTRTDGSLAVASVVAPAAEEVAAELPEAEAVGEVVEGAEEKTPAEGGES